MPSRITKTHTVTRTSGGGGGGLVAGGPAPPAAGYVQRGHTVTTVKETERTTTRNKHGESVVKTRTRTVFYVDGKAVKLNWFDRLRIRFMSAYEKQAFLAEKLLRQERRAAQTKTKTKSVARR